MNHPIDTYRDTFLSFLAKGMNYDEALQQFDEDAFRDAAFAEMESGEAVQQFPIGEHVTNDERRLPALFQLLIRAQFERRNNVDSPDYQQALALWQAGWKSEVANPPSDGFWGQTQIMSLYWRRPPRRKNSKGQLYLSTNQAHNALMREQGRTP